MKKRLRNWLIGTGMYEYLKYSAGFRIYERLFKPGVQAAARTETTFYRSFLKPGNLFFDIGANDGHKTEAFLRLADRVVCCEPDEKNFRTLRIRFRNRKDRVALEQVALGARTGTQTFYLHHEGSAFNTLNPHFKEITEADQLERWNEKIAFSGTKEVQVTTLSHLIGKYGRPDFIKIDVEGYELEVIKGLMQPVPFISVECLFPEFREALREIMDRISELDKAPLYNIALHENLLFDQFKTRMETDTFLSAFTEPHFELIIQMPGANPIP